VGYLLKAIIGAALFIGGTVLFNIKLVELLETGTCASGNQPFEVARECPEGTETVALLMVAGLFAAMIGAVLFLLRGNPPWSSGRRERFSGTFGWATFGWGLFFAGTGAATLIASKTSEAMPEDGELGGTIVGITFLVMGVPALLFALWGLATSLADRDESPMSAASATSGGGLGSFSAGSNPDLLRGPQGMTWIGPPGSKPGASGGGDTVSKLERLHQLRLSGALTEKEFEREKAKILAEM
jgi:hypothetical protein